MRGKKMINKEKIKQIDELLSYDLDILLVAIEKIKNSNLCIDADTLNGILKLSILTLIEGISDPVLKRYIQKHKGELVSLFYLIVSMKRKLYDPKIRITNEEMSGYTK